MPTRAASVPRLAGISRRRGLWRLGLLIIILLIMASYVSPVRSLYSKSQQIVREQTVTEQLRQQHDSLQLEKERLQRDTFVEQVARRDLGLVRPGEQPYVVKDLNTEPDDAASLPAPVEEKSLPGKIFDAIKSLLP